MVKLLNALVGCAALAAACDKIFVTVTDQGVYRRVFASIEDDKYDPEISGDSGNVGVGVSTFRFDGRDGSYLSVDYSGRGSATYHRKDLTTTYDLDCELVYSCQRGPYCARHYCTHYNRC